MSRIPCRKCSNESCGLYHDVHTTKCSCGTDISMITAELVELEHIPDDKRGTINESATVYYQTCPRCGTLHFTHDETLTVTKCRKCNKPAIRNVPPEEYTGDEHKDNSAVSASEKDNTAGNAAHIPFKDKDAGEKVISFEEIQANIRKATGQKNAEREPDKPCAAVSRITITDIIYGGEVTFTLSSDTQSGPYVLGRSANLAELLQRDIRVGNNHCCIEYRDGQWIVRNVKAGNGTMVKSVSDRDFILIGKGNVGSRTLRDKDEVKLGHETDSPCFSVKIEE